MRRALYSIQIVTVLVGTVLLLSACGSTEDPASTAAQTTPVRLPVAAPTVASTSGVLSETLGVAATGEVKARRDADLVFQINGTVLTVLVDEGDRVEQGALLAELDPRSLDQAVRDAEAVLVSARAELAGLTEDPTAAEAAVAEAAIGQVRGQLEQVQGSVTAEDIVAAEASVAEAEAALAQLRAGPKAEQVREATAQRNAAQAELEQSGNSLSQAKTQADIAVGQAATTVQQAQTRYSEAYWQWQYARNRGAAPADSEGEEEPNLSDSGTQKVYNAFKQAELDLRNAEDGQRAAAKQLEQARQAEIDGIALAQQNLAGVQASLDLLLRPADPDQLAQGEARVASAQAGLEKLHGQNRQGELAAASAAVAQAQAELDQLYADPRVSRLVQAEAGVARGSAALAQAQLNREYAAIRAPFAGEVAIVTIDPGDPSTASDANGNPAIRLIDRSDLYVEVQVSDADVAQVQIGQQAQLTSDALPGHVLTGTVSFVSPAATIAGNVRSYAVQIRVDAAAAPLRVGMRVAAVFEPTRPER